MRVNIEDIKEFQSLDTRLRIAEAKLKGVVIHSYTKPTRKDFEKVYISQYKLPVPIPPGVKCVWYSLSTFQVRTYTTAYDLSDTEFSGNLYNMQASDTNSSFKLLGVKGQVLNTFDIHSKNGSLYRSGSNYNGFFMPLGSDWTAKNLVNLYVKGGAGWGVSSSSSSNAPSIPIVDSSTSTNNSAINLTSSPPITGNSVYRNNRDLATSGTFYTREQNIPSTNFNIINLIPGFVIYPLALDMTSVGMNNVEVSNGTLTGCLLTIYNVAEFFTSQPAIVSGDSWYMASPSNNFTSTGRTTKFSFSFSTPYNADYYYDLYFLKQSYGDNVIGSDSNTYSRQQFKDQGLHVYGLYATDSYDYIGESS